jgi:hypothetical protein
LLLRAQQYTAAFRRNFMVTGGILHDEKVVAFETEQ